MVDNAALLKWAFRMLVVATVLLVCGAGYVFVDAAKHNRQAYAHQQSTQACKAGWYDAYQETVKLGMHRWEAACAKEVDTGGLEGARKAEKQCFIHMDDCG